VEPRARLRTEDYPAATGLHAIRYDSDGDEIEIHVGQPAPRDAVLHYFVSSPHSIQVHERAGGKVIAVDDASGLCTLIQVAHEAELR
jgi:hypothetical protein